MSQIGDTNIFNYQRTSCRNCVSIRTLDLLSEPTPKLSHGFGEPSTAYFKITCIFPTSYPRFRITVSGLKTPQPPHCLEKTNAEHMFRGGSLYLSGIFTEPYCETLNPVVKKTFGQRTNLTKNWEKNLGEGVANT